MPKLSHRVALSALFASVVACDAGSSGRIAEPGERPRSEDWFARSTVSLRGSLSVPTPGQTFALPELRRQQLVYDPGASLHCDIEDDPAYQAAVNDAGGVQWGYGVAVLEDHSQPRFLAGFQEAAPSSNEGATGGSEVEIAEADVVGLSDRAALYYTRGHGLMLIDVTGEAPKLACAAQLPGHVKKFYLHGGHLVALVESWGGAKARHAYLFHLRVEGTMLRFVEHVDLGPSVSILDSRRFNDDLVVYGAFRLEEPTMDRLVAKDAAGGASYEEAQGPEHRTLQVFHLGERLEPRMHDTLLDSQQSEHHWAEQVDESTAVDTEVGRSESYGSRLFASDRYFVVTQAVRKTFFAGFRTDWYSVCTESHTVERTVDTCVTQYERRANPDYTPPVANGGDRSCNGQTLRDCLRRVAKESNPTIEVPVGVKCTKQTIQRSVCDAYEQRNSTYPTFRYENETKLLIYAYTDEGFVRLADEARELDASLAAVSPDATVAAVTTTAEGHELLLEGSVQALQFQNGYLYAIADKQLLTYAVDGSSLIQTSSIRGTSDALQTSLFTDDKLYLSDYAYGYGYRDPTSVLRVFDLSNPAFPRQPSEDRALPGGHHVILPVRLGIFTIGSVDQFEGIDEPFLKLGLFSDPFAAEKSHLIVGTDLVGARSWVAYEKTYHFDADAERLFLPYAGADWDDSQHTVSRVGISRVASGEIVSEGALDVPELPERVRPIPQRAGALLTFAPDSVELLTSGDDAWRATEVFSYFRPFALYRLDDDDRYAEISKLGQRCKLRVVSKDELNERVDAQRAPAFDCYGASVTAYADKLLFTATQGVRFDDDGTVQVLTASEVEELWMAIDNRETCVLAPELSSEPIDYEQKPDLSRMRCYTPAELQEAEVAANAAP